MDQTELILSRMPGTRKELVARTGLSDTRVTGILKHLRATKRARVVDWRRSDGGGSFQPVLAAGPGPDVACTLRSRPDNRAARRERREQIAADRAAAAQAAQLRRTTPATPFDALFFRV